MDNLSIVKALKEPAINIMKEKKILASFIISAALYYLNTVSESDAVILCSAHNIMKRKTSKMYNSDFVTLDGNAERGYRFRLFSSYEDCINDWLLSFRSGHIRQIYDFDSVVKMLNDKTLSKNNLKPFVEAYKLEEIDKIALDIMYPKNQSIIELPSSKSSNAAVYQEMSGYKPEVNTSKTGIYKEAPKQTVKQQPKSYNKGSMFTVKYANIFATHKDKTATRSFKGNVWLYDGVLINGRYSVVINKENLGRGRDYIDGYIKKSDLM